jgi:hypothetical protein
VLATMFDNGLDGHKQFFEVMGVCLGDSVFDRVVFNTSEIINSAVQYLTPYEQKKPNRKVLRMLDNVYGEIELKVLKEWPSKQALLNNQGIA